MVNGQIKKNELLLRKAVVGEVCGVWIMFGVIKNVSVFQKQTVVVRLVFCTGQQGSAG